ncbi:hypothetical protein P8C59_003251 [Phyllachora maydis]|uniref:Reverse transcriptase Ty1/copia-type domain-containing protein n=1 Tax=Phyllachora maydis TaxID=1825666 RepID=A0AAD9I120_9PEZI|nr:hypothetical protein P8C59_003251 [Phyllachora maydis]
MADQAKGKGIAPKRAGNPADPGQSSRPLLPIRTLLEDEEDGEDYSEVIEVLKQHIKSYKRDSVSAIKNISSTLASLTNSSNAIAATTGKTSYSPRFDPFSGTIDLDSPPRPPRKEPYLGPAVDNTATSNLDPPIDTGSKKGFKDTITSSIVKELSKKAYTILDNSKLSRENFKKSGFFLDVKGCSKPILHANFAFPLGLTSYNTTKSIEPQCNKIVVEIPSNSIEKEDYRPIIEDAIVSEAIEPNKRYELRNSSAKGTTLEGKGPSLRGKRPRRPIEPLATAQAPYQSPLELVNSIAITRKDTTPFQALFNELEPGIPHIPNLERYRAIGAKGEAIIPLEKRSKSLKFTSRTEECKLLVVLGSKTYLVYIPSRRAVLKTSTIKFIEDNTVLSQPTNNTALEGELVDLDLDLEGAVSPEPSNLNTKKPISIEIGPSKLEPYESSSDSELDKPLPDKPINPVIVESTRPTISIRKPKLPEAFPQTIEPIFAPRPIEVMVPNQPITNKPLDNSNLISEGDKMQLNYYKLLAKTSSYILSFVYKARKRVISKDSTPTTYKQVLKLPRDERSKWLEAITKEFIQFLELGVFKFLPRSRLPSNRKLITCRNVLKVKKDAKNRPIKYKSRLVARGFIQVEGLDYTITHASTRAFLNSALREEIYIEIPKGLLDLAASNKAIYKLLLKYSYNPSTPNIIKLSKALYNLGVFYNTKTCHFIVTCIDDCLFIGPNIGYITDLKKRLNKVYTIEDLGPAAYFLGLSRSLNRPTKSHLNAAKNLFKYLNSTKDYSICFSYNGNTVADLGPKLSNSSNTTTKLSRDFHSKEGPRPLTTTSTSIVDSRNSKGSSRTSIINSSLVPIGFSNSDFIGDKATSKSTYGYLYKLAGRPISWKTKRATTIALSTLEAETNGLTEAIREVQDNQGSITVANDPALYARTKHTLLKFQYVREQVKAKISTIIYLNTKDKRSKWLEAITKEFIQFLELGVFKFLPRSLLPSNYKLITCRNVLKVKKDAKNRPIKYKSRLVARGFMQVEGLDYTVTYAFTSILPTWHILLAINAVLDWEIEQADFIGAFLNSAFREEIYMEIPKGLLDLAASNKAIYKLLLKYGYNPSTPNIIKLSKALYGVFYNAKTYHFIVTYIDDCLFIGPNIGYITDLKKRLNKVYAIEDLGPAAYFLGMQIIRDRPNRRLWLN